MDLQNAAPISDVDTSIEVTDRGPSFDDFERVEEVRKDLDKKAEKKKVKEEPNKQDEKVPSTKKLEDETKKPEEETTEVEDPTKDEVTKTEEPQEDEIEVKINGKIEKVKLSDLKNNYSGKVAYDKKFTELDKERKQFQSEREEFYKPFAKFKELLQTGKAGDALLHLVDMAGEDAYNFNKKLIESMTPLIKARLEMSPEQLEVMDARGELEHMRKKEQSALERSRVEQSRKELDQKIAKLQETYSVSDDDFRNAAIILKERLEAEGKFKAEAFTPEAVVDFHLASKYAGIAFKAIDKVDKTLGSDSKLVNEVINMLFDEPNLDEATLMELISEYAGVNSKLKVLTEKSQVVKKALAPSQPVKKLSPEFFSDYDE